ncbi:MAG: hypothetical protein RL477_1246 [Pseudomonadota bacterium]|jgi:endonuclease YncB( thermonuclease family)
MRGLRLVASLCLLLGLLGLVGSTAAREVLPGPVAAQVLKVLDGDTLMVRARIWVGQDIEIRVRIFGIDAPELRGRCEEEKLRARQARDFVRDAVASGRVRLHLIQYDKYAGRVLARVETESGRDLGAALLAAKLARAYDGGTRAGWCG